MTRTLTFGPCTDPATQQPSACCKKFTLFVNMFIAGGNVLYFNPQMGPTSRPRDVQKMEAEVVRAYKSVSEEDPKQPLVRSLKPEGGTLTLTQPAFVLLEKYLEASPRGTQEADVIDDLLDWVSAAPRSKD